MGKLKRLLFTEQQMKKLEANPTYSMCLSQPSRTYLHSSWQPYMPASRGKTPAEIFIRAGFDLDVIDRKKPKKQLEWACL